MDGQIQASAGAAIASGLKKIKNPLLQILLGVLLVAVSVMAIVISVQYRYQLRKAKDELTGANATIAYERSEKDKARQETEAALQREAKAKDDLIICKEENGQIWREQADRLQVRTQVRKAAVKIIKQIAR